MRMNATAEFSGRSAFVTGAGTGIGAATAAELAARGAKVAMMGRRAGMLEETAAAIRAAGGEVLHDRGASGGRWRIFDLNDTYERP
jgi:NAD(P)-dependent dehydrogenase (short-subunit alcohol dehydrogenase family)